MQSVLSLLTGAVMVVLVYGLSFIPSATLTRSDDIGGWFHRNYYARGRTRLLYPWVRWRRSRQPIQPAHVREDCDCTWCRCQHEQQGLAVT